MADHMKDALDRHLAGLENIQARHLGDAQPDVCRGCYVMYDPKGCPCGRKMWTPLPVVVMELRLLLEDSADKEHAEANVDRE